MGTQTIDAAGATGVVATSRFVSVQPVDLDKNVGCVGIGSHGRQVDAGLGRVVGARAESGGTDERVQVQSLGLPDVQKTVIVGVHDRSARQNRAPGNARRIILRVYLRGERRVVLIEIEVPRRIVP